MRSSVTELVKARVPPAAQHRLLEARVAARSLSWRHRLLPDFFVLGAQRSGTSSLYKYLEQHPWILASIRKEVGYLSRDFKKGEPWYRAHFPLASRRSIVRHLARHELLTFEATPDYLFHPLAPGRARSLVPHAKLIVLLRNPVDRAYSHYRHEVRLGLENLSFDEALEMEPDRLAGGIARLESDPRFARTVFLRHSYLARGAYADQLECWMQHYPRRSLLVIQSERLYKHPSDVYRTVLRFLGVPEIDLAQYRVYTNMRGRMGREAPLSPSTRAALEDHFRPHNERLFRMLGERFDWGSRDDPAELG